MNGWFPSCPESLHAPQLLRSISAAFLNAFPVCDPVLSPDQRVASFCTMTDMQRAEALQISRELSRRVVEAEGAALEAE